MKNFIKTEEKMKKIKEEWLRMIKGKPVDKSIVSPIIYNSWQRSLDYKVDPYKKINNLIPTMNENISSLTSFEELIKKYGEFIKVIAEMTTEMGLICRIADKNAKTIKVLSNHEALEAHLTKGNFFAIDSSENIIGTNALCLAVKENRYVQVLGAEHFNYYFHKINCSAAPIHNEKGEVIGVINISTDSIDKTSIQTLALVISIANALDSHLYINKMLEDLTIRNDTLQKIMEYQPSGIVYLDENNQVESYNNKILELLKLNLHGDEKNIKELILKYILTTNLLEQDRELNNNEILLKVKDRTESFLVSNKKVLNSNKTQKGNIVIIDKTDSILKLHSSLRGNKAIYNFDHIIGKDPKLIETKELANKVAQSSSSVIIYGESGTGKELLSQAIHNASPRKNNSFVAINCGAIPSELIESELFGYEAGAFTGALKGGKPGKIEIATGGTIFLDEIESMPLNLQIKLLRVLSANKIVKVGGTREIPIDIRLISATKKDLLNEVENGNFREDLFYRINIFTLEIPPLRERKNDIPLLVDHFISFFSDLNIECEEEFYSVLISYDWRGNIRELRNVIERSILFLGSDTKLTREHLPEKIQQAYFKSMIEKENQVRQSFISKNMGFGLMKTAEEIAITIALKEKRGNLSKAAKYLGIARSTLYQKIRENPKLENVLKSYK